MKILMFGRGVIASIYGWALEQAGHQVEFYVRPGRSASYGEAITLDLLDGRRRLGRQRVVTSWPVTYRESLEPDHDFDLVVLSVSHQRLPEAVAFLTPRLGDATLLMFSNFWEEPSTVIGDIPRDRVAWGFPGAGGGYGSDGVLHGGLLPFVVFGTLGTPPTKREQPARRVFADLGLRINEQPDFRGWVWIHFLANVGMHAQGQRLGSLSKLVGASADLREALLTTRELLPLLESRGIDLKNHRTAVLPYRAPSWLVANLMSFAIASVPLARRSLEAQNDVNAAEPRDILRDALAAVREQGITAPRLEAAEQFVTTRHSE